MKYTELTERVIDIIKNKVYLSEAQKDELKPETTMSFFGLDSLDAIELVMEFEKEFIISIPDEDAEKFDDNSSLGDIIDYLANRLDIKENNYIWSDYMFEGTAEENDNNFLFYIQGNDWRAKEVIALLEKHGGINQDNFLGRGKDKYYFIEPETRVINWLYITSNMCTFLRKFYTELHIDNTEPIFRVGQLIKEKYNDNGSIYEITDISDGCYHCKLEHGAASIPWSLQDNWTIAPIFEVGTQVINIETADVYTLTELKQDTDGNYYYIVAEDDTLTIPTSEQYMYTKYICNVEYIIQTGDDTCVGRIFKSKEEAMEIAEGLKKYSCNKDAKFSIRRLISK